MHLSKLCFIWCILDVQSVVESGSLNQPGIDSTSDKETNPQKKNTKSGVMLGDFFHIKEELEKSKIENDKLRQENNRLQKKIDLLQRLQEMKQPVSNYDDIQDEDLGDHQNPLYQFQSPEPRFTSQSYHAEVAELEEEFGQIKTQLQWTHAVLRSNQGNEKLAIKDKPMCKDEKNKNVCQKLKKKNKGKGCNKSSTKKKCQRTCGLCDDGQDQSIIFQGGLLVDLSFSTLGKSDDKMEILDEKKKKDVKRIINDQFCSLGLEAQAKACTIQNLEFKVTKELVLEIFEPYTYNHDKLPLGLFMEQIE